jgi:hypothetical protein
VKGTARPSDPPWAIELKLALARVAEAEQKHRHAADRVPVTLAAVAEAKAALSRAEAAGMLEYAGRVADEEAAARQRLDAAEMEAARAQRIVAALAEAVEAHRAALTPLVETAREGLMQWVEAELAVLDREFALAIEHVADIVARAVSIADAAGATYLADPLLRIRLPASLVRASTVLQVGTLTGMVSPEETPTSERGAALHALIVAARLATAPEAERRAAADRAAQAEAAEHERAANDAARDAEAAALAASQRAKLGVGPVRDFASAEPA